MKSIHLICKFEKLRDEIERGLALNHVHLSLSRHAKFTLLVDAPWGWAQGQVYDLDMESTLVLSDSPCPEYHLDLLSYKPIALLHEVSIEEIAYTLDELCHGNQVASYIAFSSSLTPVERLTLRLTAQGFTTEHIASVRNISKARVKNIIQVIYQKLNLNTRAQLALYYHGIWHVLEDAGWEYTRLTTVPTVPCRSARHQQNYADFP